MRDGENVVASKITIPKGREKQRLSTIIFESIIIFVIVLRTFYFSLKKNRTEYFCTIKTRNLLGLKKLEETFRVNTWWVNLKWIDNV